MTPYPSLRFSMKSGDVIAFSGNSRVSKIIQWKTGSPYSHVGIVLNTDMGGGIGQAVLLVESTTNLALPDDITGGVHKGVQMHFLSRRLESYDGSAWWLPLKESLPPYASYNMQQWLREKSSAKIPYDAIQALGAGVDLFDWIPGLESERDFSSLFCSEMVTAALQVAGVVDDSINPSEQTPSDVVKLACFGQSVQVSGLSAK